MTVLLNHTLRMVHWTRGQNLQKEAHVHFTFQIGEFLNEQWI